MRHTFRNIFLLVVLGFLPLSQAWAQSGPLAIRATPLLSDEPTEYLISGNLVRLKTSEGTLRGKIVDITTEEIILQTWLKGPQAVPLASITKYKRMTILDLGVKVAAIPLMIAGAMDIQKGYDIYTTPGQESFAFFGYTTAEQDAESNRFEGKLYMGRGAAFILLGTGFLIRKKHVVSLDDWELEVIPMAEAQGSHNLY